MAEKRYFWLKLQDTFFSQKEIKKLRKIAGGDTYTIIYLKLQLISLRNGGKIYYEGLEETFYEEMALELDEDSENVKFTILFLEKYGLIQTINENEYLMTNVEKSTGSETQEAVRVRRYREKQKALQCNANVQKRNVEIEKEIEKEIELQQDKENVDSGGSDFNIFKYAEMRNFIFSAIQLQQIQEDVNIYSLEEVKKALDIADDNGKHSYSYVRGILQKRRAGTEQKKQNDSKLEEMKRKAANGEDPF